MPPPLSGRTCSLFPHEPRHKPSAGTPKRPLFGANNNRVPAGTQSNNSRTTVVGNRNRKEVEAQNKDALQERLRLVARGSGRLTRHSRYSARSEKRTAVSDRKST